MATMKRSPRGQRRGQPAKTQSLDDVQDTFRLWRKHHLDYDQTKYVAVPDCGRTCSISQEKHVGSGRYL